MHISSPRLSWAGVMATTIIQDNTYVSTLASLWASLTSNITAIINTFHLTLSLGRCPGRTGSSPEWARF